MQKLSSLIKKILNFTLFCLSKLIPKRKKRWIFGSWVGEKFSDNSKWVYLDVMKTHNDIEAVWIAKNDDVIHEIKNVNGKVLKYNSLKSIYYVLTAEVIFVTQGYFDLCSFNIIGGAYKVQLWHGIPLKKLNFYKNYNDNFLSRTAYKMSYKINTYDKYIAPSEECAKSFINEFKISEDKIIYVGQPRNDVFFNTEYKYNSRQGLNSFIKNKYGYDISEKKIITYMPTFRDNDVESFSIVKLNDVQLNKLEVILKKHNAILIEKSHFVAQKRNDNNHTMLNSDIMILKDVDAQELLVNSDILITDYSSCYFDFMLLDRPIIHFIYDYEKYKLDRGLLYEIKQANGGVCCNTIDDTIANIEIYLENSLLDSNTREAMREKFLTFEDGKSANKLINYIINRD